MQDVVITGLGIVCPLGIGREAVWSAIENRRSGIRTSPQLAQAGQPIPIAGEVPEFDPKQYVKPRKSLKVMCRETQLAFTATELAWADAKLDQQTLDPERLGVVLGANMFRSEIPDLTDAFTTSCEGGPFQMDKFASAGMRQMYPLWMLKYLPNMSACHVGIAHDVRGPINSIIHGDVTALLAIIEASDVIARGHADLMIAGAASTMVSMVDLAWHAGARMSRNVANPAAACRPFDADRDGTVGSEGGAIFILESREHAQRRQAAVQGRVLGYGRRCEPSAISQRPTGQAVRHAIEAALESSHIPASEVGHVNAHGLGTVEDDAIEAQAIRETLGDVPVTGTKSFFGNLGAASGAAELMVSLIGLQQGVVPPTLNYDRPDPACPVNVVTSLQESRSPAVLALNHKLTGQAVALVISSEA